MTETTLAVLGVEQARALTERIRTGTEVIWELLSQAYIEGAWIALGYASWDDYCTSEFGTSRIAIPREDRQEVVLSLRQSGLSQRAIASATGVSQATIYDDLQVTGNRSPDGGAVIIGLDGKTYQPPAPPPPPKPRWTAVERDIQRQLNAGETVVVTLRGFHDNVIEWAKDNDLYIRVDRRSDWGNPFVMDEDGDRDTVIANYQKHYLPYKPSLLGRLDELRGRALGCWCAPEPCHADVLKELCDQ